MFLFKCGNCGKLFSVDENRIVQNSYGRVCPNCGSDVPLAVQNFSKSIITMKSHSQTDKWEIFRVPQTQDAKLQVILTSLTE